MSRWLGLLAVMMVGCSGSSVIAQVSGDIDESPLSEEDAAVVLPPQQQMTLDEVERRVEKPARKSLSVEARLSSSTHIDWIRIGHDDPIYQALREKLMMDRFGDPSRVHLLPYGLKITVQANDPTTRLALHVNQVVRQGEPPQLVSPRALTAFVNGERFQSMSSDLELLSEAIWVERGSERIDYHLLFVLKTEEGDRSGEYQINFRLLSAELP